ncbi:hypothetical protein EG328_002610 [Venturia inaequalis]|nr:hypothetical protein EG328_002610 [Venturia inaequalis]RDI83714.1 hypothetical protein Vi05172_g6380 [Venturia inaequalis]
MKFRIALLGAAAQLGWGLVAPGPSPTDTVTDGIDLYGITPKPTTVALLHPGLAKRQAGQSLLGWVASDNTCGYVSGSLGAVKTCQSTEQCAAVNIDAVGTMGCCNESKCRWLGNCIESVDYATGCDQACRQDVNTVKCTEALYPYCYGYKIPGITVGFFSCDSIPQTGTFDAFLTTFKGETDIRTWEAVYDTDTAIGSSNAIILASSLGTSNAFDTSLIGIVTSTKPVVTDNGPKPTTKKTTSIGPIIGGVVGGIAVIGAIIAGVIIALMKKRKHNANAAAALPPTNLNNAQPASPDMRQPMYGQSPSPQGPYSVGPYPPPQPQQNPQRYNQPQQQQFDQNAVSPSPGYFAAGKTDQNYPDQSYHVKQDGGAQVTEQAVPLLPPTSPAPPYAQPVQQGRENWNVSPPAHSPPPQMMQQGGSYQPPQLQSQGPAPVELGTNASTPQRNAEGRPIHEAE